MKKSVFIFLCCVLLSSFQTAGAQTLLRLPVGQNPVFEVSVNEVDISMTTPEVILGADVVIAGGSGVYSYSWSLNGQPLSADATLRVDKAGDYVLEVSDQCDCKQTVVFHVTTTNAVGHVAADDVRQTVVLTADGKLVGVADGGHVDMSRFPAGLYIINRVGRDGRISVSKLRK